MGTPKIRFKRRRSVWCGAQGDASAGFYRVLLDHLVRPADSALGRAPRDDSPNPKKSVAPTQCPLGNEPAQKTRPGGCDANLSIDSERLQDATRGARQATRRRTTTQYAFRPIQQLIRIAYDIFIKDFRITSLKK
jgi:hypothetical protein